MKRKKIKLKPKFIIPLILFFTGIVYIFFFSYDNLKIEDEHWDFYLKDYFKSKNPYNIHMAIKKIFENYPEIINIQIKHNIIKKEIYLKVKNSDIIAKICDINKCYYLDNYARIIKPKTEIKKNVILIKSYLEIKENTYLNPKIEKFLVILFEFANYQSFIIKGIKIYSNFDIGVIDKEGREFLFDINKENLEQIKKLYIFLQKFKEAKSKRIDLRIKNKIYFM